MEKVSVLHLPGGASFGGLLVGMELVATERTHLHDLAVHDSSRSTQLPAL